MIPPLAPLVPGGDGAHWMTPEQVIKHYRKWGMPERRRSPRERNYHAFDFLTLN